jgi:hypothetical protein
MVSCKKFNLIISWLIIRRKYYRERLLFNTLTQFQNIDCTQSDLEPD